MSLSCSVSDIVPIFRAENQFAVVTPIPPEIPGWAPGGASSPPGSEKL